MDSVRLLYNSDVEIGGGIGKGIVGHKNEHPDGTVVVYTSFLNISICTKFVKRIRGTIVVRCSLRGVMRVANPAVAVVKRMVPGKYYRRHIGTLVIFLKCHRKSALIIVAFIV